MNTPPTRFKSATITLLLWLALFSIRAHAAIDNTGVLDLVLNQYQTAASTWKTVILARATWLFWLLATISMVWTFGMMALRKADIGDFFAEFIRFTVTTGFFWWLLANGPVMATGIMDSLRTIAANASGNPATLTPSGMVDIGFEIFSSMIEQTTILSPIDSICGILMSAVILVVLALVAVNMLILLISGWILAYAGIFILGFGGAQWTSDLAIGYFKSVLGLALQLMTMVLLVGIGKSFVDQYYAAMSTVISVKELGVMLIVSVILLALVNKVPPLIGALSGGHIHALGQGFGTGAAIGAAAFGGVAVATAGAALAAGATNMAGGAQAIMAAFSRASAEESRGDVMAADGGVGGDGGGARSLASAMGDSGGGASSMGGGSEAAASPTASLAAKAGHVAAGTAGKLAQGSWEVAKVKASAMKGSALDAISQTTGGKIAAAIHAHADTASQAKDLGNIAASFDSNSLSEGSEQAADAGAEVAAFRDREPKAW
jgi:type IV secretion system protein VirB6/type IV secretion system protein TrbL